MILEDPKSISDRSLSKISYMKEKKMLTESNQSKQQLSQENDEQELKFITFRIEIEDNGVGIKKQNLNSLFQDFNRLDTSLNKNGTGLGLSICKSLIEKMGGRVDVDSEFGVGSNFKI